MDGPPVFFIAAMVALGLILGAWWSTKLDDHWHKPKPVLVCYADGRCENAPQ